MSHVVVSGGHSFARAVDIQYPQTNELLSQAPWLEGRRARLLAQGTPLLPTRHHTVHHTLQPHRWQWPCGYVYVTIHAYVTYIDTYIHAYIWYIRYMHKLRVHRPAAGCLLRCGLAVHQVSIISSLFPSSRALHSFPAIDCMRKAH